MGENNTQIALKGCGVKSIKSIGMATGVVRYPPRPTQLLILFWLTYPENMVKIHALG